MAADKLQALVEKWRMQAKMVRAAMSHETNPVAYRGMRQVVKATEHCADELAAALK